MKRIAPLLLLLALTSSAWGWWGVGHGLLTQAAVQALPEEMPAFFLKGEETVANVVHDADLFKNRATPHLGNFEHSEHYFDTELLKGKKPPEMRYAFLDSCAALDVKPEKNRLDIERVSFVYQQITVTYEDPAIQAQDDWEAPQG